MGRGCCLGCLFSLVVAALLVAGGIYLANRFDIITAEPPVDTVAHVGGAPQVLLWVDPDRPELLELLTAGMNGAPGAFIEALMPYEGIYTAKVDSERKIVSGVLAVSLRRFAGFLAAVADPDKDWRFFTDQYNIRAAEEQEGLWVVRSEWPTDEASRALVVQTWPAQTAGPAVPSKEHALELLLSNEAGDAWLAIEAMLAEGKPHEYVTMATTGNVPGFTLDTLPQWAQRIARLHGTMDYAPGDKTTGKPDSVQSNWEIICREPEDAGQLLGLLQFIRASVQQQLSASGLTLEGDWVVEESAIRGAFHVDKVRETLLQRIRAQAK